MTLEQAVERVEAELGLLDRLWGREQKEPLNIHRFMEALSLVLARAKEPRVYALGEEERKQAGDLSRFRAAIDAEPWALRRERDLTCVRMERDTAEARVRELEAIGPSPLEGQAMLDHINNLSLDRDELKERLEKVREIIGSAIGPSVLPIVNQIRDVVIDKGPNDAERD